jgi:hypothetical protein
MMRSHFWPLLLALLFVSCAKPKKLEDYYMSDFKDSGCRQTVALSKISTVEMVGAQTYFDTGAYSELITCVPSTWPHDYLMLPLFAMRFTDLHEGDVFQIDVESEFTNDVDTNFMVAMFLTLGPSPTPIFAEQVTKPSGYNITPGSHHGIFPKGATYRVPRDMAEAYLTVNVYAADGRYLMPSFLKVEQNYGRMSGLINRQ